MVRSTILFYTWFNVQLRPRSRTVTLGLPEIWVVTAMLMYIPVLSDMIPCRSVRINQSINLSEKLTALLCYISECQRTDDVFTLTLAAWRLPV